jgi:hypothetical protein
VHPPPLGQTLTDLGVAHQAFQLASARKLVTLRAIERAIQRFVWLRERPGRDLRVARARVHANDDDEESEKRTAQESKAFDSSLSAQCRVPSRAFSGSGGRIQKDIEPRTRWARELPHDSAIRVPD